MTLNEIVNDYIRHQRPYTSGEMMDYANEPTTAAAIRRAALCEMKDGKRHPHQRRIPKRLLGQVESKLQALRRKLSNAADFDALHILVGEEIGGLRGIGALTIYDIAHRIGSHLRKAPTRVYLHAGVRVGARALGIGGDSFDPMILPKPFSRLAPSEIEDCLCIYKDQLRGATQQSVRVPGCSVAKKPRRGCV